MGRSLRSFESSHSSPQQASGDSNLVGGSVQVGRNGGVSRPGLPAPNELLSTAELAALLFPHVKHPRQAVHHWITRGQIPTYRVGGRIRVLGQSVMESLKRKPRRLKAVS